MTSGVLGKMRCLAMVYMMLMMVMMAGRGTEAAISCLEVVLDLTPCVNYVREGGTVPSGCCAGLRQLVAAVQANEDLQTACSCAQQMAAAIPGLQWDLVDSIPVKCGVSLPCKLSPTLDCSKVHW